MAVTFPEETLRAVQNSFSLHKAILSEYATYSTNESLCTTLSPAYCTKLGDLVTILFGGCSVARVPPIRH